MISPKVRRILDALTLMNSDEVREVRYILEEKFGFGGPDSLGVREPKHPVPPVLMGTQRN